MKEKLLWNEKFLLSLNHRPSFLSEESLPHAIIVVSWGISDLNAHIDKFRGRQVGRLLKLLCVTIVELTVMSDQRVLHLKRSQASCTSSQKSYSKVSAATKAYSSKEDLGPQEALCGETEDCRKGNLL